MSFREELQKTEEYQDISGESDEATQQVRQVETPQQAVAPVISLEKTDVQFWAIITQTVLLFLIYQQIKQQGGL